ncbi:MAG: GNAT family N-acetyltransferase [Acidimicrobiales bacterium]
MPAPPSRADEARLAYANLVAYSRVNTTWCRRGSSEEDGGVLCYAGGSWIPVNCNGAFRLDESVPAPDLVARADAFFARRRRGYTVKVRDTGADDDVEAVCRAAGLVAVGDPFPEMICRAPLADPAPPPGVDLRPVTDERGLRHFSAVNAEAYATYGMPPEVFTDSFDRPARLLADDHVGVVVAYRDGQPVATALTFLSGGIASLQWVGTVPAARQSGLGRVVTQAATNVAFARGAAACTLQASVMGEPLYTALGYETLYRYQNYVRWEPPPGPALSGA